jgi:hypothetical protein
MNRRRLLCAAALPPPLAWLAACSGGGSGASVPASAAPAAPAPPAAPAGTADAPSSACHLPFRPGADPVPVGVPAQAIDVRLHGVRGDGSTPDGEALQRLFDRVQPGQWLWFPPGVYVQDRALRLRQAGVTLSGYGAALHATDPASQALILQGQGSRVLGFTMTATTDRRRAAPWESRIAVWREDGGDAIADVQIRDNRIVESGPPGTAGANSSSSSAIYVERASRFVIAGNVVRRSLADGIHITGGSRDGLVAGNLVRESGDDMIAVVSYLDADAATPLPAAAALLAQMPARRDRFLVRNVLITGNDLAAGYWGRGLSVVGGEDITIIDNTLDRCVHAAAVYLAREPHWRTFGVRNVRVAGNRISRVQTLEPAYSPLDEPQRSSRTGHGAIELVAHVLQAEAELPALAAQLGIDTILLEDNRIDDVGSPGIRVGQGWAEWAEIPMPQGALSRYTGAPVRGLALRANEITRSHGGIALLNEADRLAEPACQDNRVDGAPWAAPRSQALSLTTPRAAGSRVSCAAL